MLIIFFFKGTICIMLRQRIKHWTCSKFADWIRGEEKPFALEWNKWEDWRKEQELKRPWRFWLSDTLLKRLQDLIYFPNDVYREIKFYIRNRWIDKTHYLKTNLRPGNYYDLDHRILNGLFNELVDFVEIELSHLGKWDKSKKYKFKNGRCVIAGLDYLDWAISLTYGTDFNYEKSHKLYNKPTPQAKASKEILDLYNWWKNREYRLYPHKESGWSEFYDSENKKEKDDAFKKLNKLEEKYEKEDEQMLIRLIKIRKHLWC